MTGQENQDGIRNIFRTKYSIIYSDIALFSGRIYRALSIVSASSRTPPLPFMHFNTTLQPRCSKSRAQSTEPADDSAIFTRRKHCRAAKMLPERTENSWGDPLQFAMARCDDRGVGHSLFQACFSSSAQCEQTPGEFMIEQAFSVDSVGCCGETSLYMKRGAFPPSPSVASAVPSFSIPTQQTKPSCSFSTMVAFSFLFAGLTLATGALSAPNTVSLSKRAGTPSSEGTHDG